MKDSRRIFIITETVLAVLFVIILTLMFGTTTQRKRVTVVVSNSDAGKWTAFTAGIKQAARNEELDITIAGTGRISGASEQRMLLQQAIAEGAGALVVQPAPGKGTALMLQEIAGKCPMILVTGDAVWETAGNQKLQVDSAEEEDPSQTGMTSRKRYQSQENRNGTTGLRTVGPDNYACGCELADFLVEDYGGSLADKTIGILNHTRDTETAINREDGFMQEIEAYGADVKWKLYGLEKSRQPEEEVANMAQADIIVALDSDTLEIAGSARRDKNVHGAVVYGIGSSGQNLYDLDHDDIQGMIYLNGFDVGYQSIEELAGRLGRPSAAMQNISTGWLPLHRDDLFREENEDLLFMVE